MVVKRIVLLIGFVFLNCCLFVIKNAANAQSTPLAQGTPAVYKVTMRQFEISNDNGNTWITVVNQPLEDLDIASISAGQAVGGWVTNASIPAGVYNKVKPTASATFKMKGYVDYDPGSGTVRYYTSASGIKTIAPAAWGAGPADYDEQQITVPADGCPGGVCANEETRNITIVPGRALRQRIRFDVSGRLGLYEAGPGNYVFYPLPPQVDVIEIAS